MEKLTLIRPDDWHVHLRDGDMLSLTVPHIARQFGRAIVMPNLATPVTRWEQARDYRERILAHVPAGTDFTPLMTLYLCDETKPEWCREGQSEGVVTAVKLYPAGATTNSAQGVTDVAKLTNVFETLSDIGMPLLIHGEVTHSDVDVFDREKVFIDTVLSPIRAQHPELKIVLEHITTEEAVQFVSEHDNTAATITAHHLLYDRNAIFKGGIRPHFYCLPVLKRHRHQEALIKAATSGDPKFFLGTDSAPHVTTRKESACGCAGIYTAHAAIEFYLEVFEKAGKLEAFEGFASHYGPDFYGLPRNSAQVTLEKSAWEVPESYHIGSDTITPLGAKETLHWSLR